MSSALDEELCRLEAFAANSAPTAVGLTKKICVARIVAAVQPAVAPTTSCYHKRRLWISPLAGAAPPRARQRTTQDADPSVSDSFMKSNGHENQDCTEPLPEPADADTGGSSDDAVQRPLEIDYYQKMMDQCRKEDEMNKKENTKKIEAMRELRRVYLFGLLKVSKLQDLREAPDAIMPGNFVDKNSIIEDESSETKRNEAVGK